MKTVSIPRILFLAMLAITPIAFGAESSPATKVESSLADEALTVSQAGKWSFALDPQGVGVALGWFAKVLPNSIQLPGNIVSQGYGDKNSG